MTTSPWRPAREESPSWRASSSVGVELLLLLLAARGSVSHSTDLLHPSRLTPSSVPVTNLSHLCPPACELSSKVPFYTFQEDEEEDLEHFLELRTVRPRHVFSIKGDLERH